MKNTLQFTRSISIATATLSFAIFCVSATSGWANNCKLNITLSPAGSFAAESSDVVVKGSTTKEGNSVSAKDVVLHLDTLKTGIELRDEHMKKKYLETDKYPDAVLTHAEGKDGTFQGELQMRDVKKPISGTYVFEGNEFVASFETHMSDFNVQKVKYMGVGANDTVKVQIRLAATPVAASATK